MERKEVNRKALAIEANYGYLNLHLELLFLALKENHEKEINYQMLKVKEYANILNKLGYFERGVINV